MAITKRKTYLDLARIVAICGVLALHIFGFTQKTYTSINNVQFDVSNAIISILYFGVPVFFMISGALMLNPNKKISLQRIYLHYLPRLIIALLIFGFITEFLNQSYKAHWNIASLLNIQTIIVCFKSIATFSYSLAGEHFWFLYMIIFIYIILPVLRYFTKRANNFVYAALMIFLLVICPVCRNLIKYQTGISLPYIDLYLFYYLFGYWWQKNNIHQKFMFYVVIFVGVVSAVGLICGSLYHIEIFKGESCYLNIMYSVCVFMLISFYKYDNITITKLSQNTFGIYLIHPLIYTYGLTNFVAMHLPFWMCILATYLITLIASCTITWFLRKNKIVRKLL